jgi:hypothetical protein
MSDMRFDVILDVYGMLAVAVCERYVYAACGMALNDIEQTYVDSRCHHSPCIITNSQKKRFL